MKPPSSWVAVVQVSPAAQVFSPTHRPVSCVRLGLAAEFPAIVEPADWGL